MAPPQLEKLAERLLEAGIAPRHVRRLMRELHEHYEDLVRAELAAGASLPDAERRASELLGNEEHLAESALAQPSLRSTGVRYPRLVFGAGPLLAWLGIFVATHAVVKHIVAADASLASAPWVLPSVHALCLLYVRVLPIVLGSLTLVAVARRRLAMRYAVVGASLVNLLAGTLSIHVFGPAQGSEGGQLGISSTLLPFLVPSSDFLGPRDGLALGAALVRCVAMLAVTFAAYFVLMRREQKPDGVT